MAILDELVAGGQRQKEYSDFVDRYEQGHPSQPAEQAGEHANRKEEARPARYPARSVERDP